MSDNTNETAVDLSVLDSKHINLPSSEALQAKILAATKSMPQGDSVIESVASKSTLRPWFSRRSMPVALALSLLVVLAFWTSKQSLTQNPDNVLTNANSSAVALESSKTQLSEQELPMSVEELELFELLLMQDELILAQF